MQAAHPFRVWIGWLLEALLEARECFLELSQFRQRHAQQAVQFGQARLQLFCRSNLTDSLVVVAKLEVDDAEGGMYFGNIRLQLCQLLEVRTRNRILPCGKCLLARFRKLFFCVLICPLCPNRQGKNAPEDQHRTQL